MKLEKFLLLLLKNLKINNYELRITNYFDKARTHDKIVEHVRWLPDVLEVIDLSVQV